VKEVFYFSHDYTARTDPKIMQMRSVYDGQGYGWYWMLVEMLYEEPTHKLSMQGKYVWNAFALQMNATAENIEAFVKDCISEFHLFDSDNEYFWSDSVSRRVQEREMRSEKARESANKRWNTSKSMQPQSDGNANASKNDAIKERKGKERKDNNSGASPQKFTPPDLEEVKAYCEERNNNVDADKWYNFYASKGWMIGKNKMKDWKRAVMTWEKGDRNGTNKQPDGQSEPANANVKKPRWAASEAVL